MKTKFKGVVWLGVRTKKFDELVGFYQKMGLPLRHEKPGFRAFDLPNGDQIEVFSEEYVAEDGMDYKQFVTGPVAGFLVDNIEETKTEMEAEGIKFLGQIGEGGRSRWAHFMGVDGNAYELKERKQN